MQTLNERREQWLKKATTWSNRAGLVLTQHRTNVWAAERPFLWNTIDVGSKSVIIKLQDGSLWVHSPVELDNDMRAALQDLGGDVKHVVSPCFEHVKFAKQWIDAFPGATAWGCPDIKQKYPNIGYELEVPDAQGELPSVWPSEIEPVFFDCETNPFTGKPFFNEVNFVHTPSKVLITTDTFWNYPTKDTPAKTRAWKFGMDKVYGPFYSAFMAKPDVLDQVLQKLMSLEFTSILPAHGRAVGPSDDKELSDGDELYEKFGGDVKLLLKDHFTLWGAPELAKY